MRFIPPNISLILKFNSIKQLQKIIKEGKKYTNPVQEQRMDARRKAKRLFVQARNSIAELFTQVVSSRFSAKDTDCERFTTVLNYLQSPKGTGRQVIALTNCVKTYCDLRKQAISHDDETDMNFITHEEIMNLKEVTKRIMSALKERCKDANINILTTEYDDQRRLPCLVELYNLARKMCNALSTVARALQKLRGYITNRSNKEYNLLVNTYLEKRSKESRNNLANSFSIFGSKITPLIGNKLRSFISESIKNIVITQMDKNIASDFVEQPRRRFAALLRRGRYSNMQIDYFLSAYGSWHFFDELRRGETCNSIFGGPPCQGYCSDRLLDDYIDPMISIEKKRLLKMDLQEFVLKQTGYNINDLPETNTTEMQNICRSMTIFLGMACGKKTEGVISTLYHGLQKMHEHVKFFFSQFFVKIATPYLVKTAIENLMIIFSPGERTLRKAEVSNHSARTLKNTLSGLKKFFPNCADEMPFRKHLQKLRDMAQVCFDRGFVASRYGISFV